MRNVRSETLTTCTPSTALSRSTTCWPCFSSLVLKVMSRVIVVLPTSMTSMAPMSAPPLPRAEVTLPSMPGLLVICRRTVRLWLAVGAFMMLPPRGRPKVGGILPRPGGRRSLIAGERAQVQLAAVGVDRDLVTAEEGVAEDAVEPRTRVVQHDGCVAQLEVPDPERAHDGGRAGPAAAERLPPDGGGAGPA